jgi:hypothetical protein
VLGADVDGEDIRGVIGVVDAGLVAVCCCCCCLCWCEVVAERDEESLVCTLGGRRIVEGGEEGEASLAGLGRGDRVTLGHRWIVRSTSSGKSVLRRSVSEGDLPDINIL